MRETKIVELTRKYQFDRYSFSRLTDNKIFDYVSEYLAAIFVNSFRKYKGRSRMPCEVWLKKLRPAGQS